MRFHLYLKPTLRKSPIALDCGPSDVQDARYFVFSEAGEKLHFDDAGLPGVQRFQPGQGLIDGQNIHVRIGGGDGVLHLDLDRAAAAALGLASSGMVHQDMPHHCGGDREEVAAIPDVYGALPDQADVEFVDQGCRLQRVRILFPGERATSKGAQLIVDLRHQHVSGTQIAVAPAPEQLNCIVRWRPRRRHDFEGPRIPY